MNETPAGPLAGLRVLDFGVAYAGPYSTLLLEFLGAEVIKIESRRRPDLVRLPDALFASDPTSAQRNAANPAPEADRLERSVMFHDVNLGKLSVAIDLTTPEGIAVAKQLAGVSDIVLDNFSPGVMDRLGLGYEVLHTLKPDIIVISTSAAGSVGPESDSLGFATIFNAEGGLTHLTGYPEGRPAESRDSTDLRVGSFGAFALLAALLYRQTTGRGQYIDLSAREVITSEIGDELMDFALNGRVPNRQGNHDPMSVPHNAYRCLGEDRWISIAIATEAEWHALCAAAGHPEWERDPRFATVLDRKRNEDELDTLVECWTREHTQYELVERLQRAGVAAAPTLTMEQAYRDPHLRERGAFTRVEHRVLGRRDVVGPPWRLSKTPAAVHGAAPLLGEHTSSVLDRLLGMDEATSQRLDASAGTV
ncbi:MAG: CoA transferase [Chloroflexi bacterium]|nr:CoA transferase [Chloroflexota bacterium]